MDSLGFLLNQMFNKAKGCEIVKNDAKFSGSSDFRKFRHIVARLEEENQKSPKGGAAGAVSNMGEDDDFQEARVE